MLSSAVRVVACAGSTTLASSVAGRRLRHTERLGFLEFRKE
jgi:hypothetical protein